MRNDSSSLGATEQYAAAHVAHYTDKNLHAALDLYRRIVTTHPGAPEAGYSHSQVQNIVNSVVPKQDLLAAQIELALAHAPKEHNANDPRAATCAPTEGNRRQHAD